MKKLLSALLVCVMLLGVLAACTTPNDEPVATTGTPDASNAPLAVVENGATQFKIVYNTKELIDNNTLSSKIDNLISSIESRTGAEMKKVGTWDNTYDPNAYEILIGSTGYEETLAASNGLRTKDYRIVRQGNKIVIVGGCASALESAVTYFTSKVVNAQTKEDGVTTVVFGAEQELYYNFSYKVSELKINDSLLSEYTIVYPVNYNAAEYEIAHSLSNAISNATGYILAVESDKKTYGKEILIGKTERSDEVALESAEYAFTVLDNGSLQINAGSTVAYYYAAIAFTNTFLKEACTITSTKGSASEPLSASKDALLTDAGDVRIIFHNVYGGQSPSDGVYTNPKLAYNLSTNLYVDYGADIICLQEFNSWPRNNDKGGMAKLLAENGYKEVPYTSSGNTPIFYNPQKLTLLKNGTVVYDSYLPDSDLTALTPGTEKYDDEKYNDNKRYGGVSKMAVWGIFKDNGTGKIFAVVSTHLDHQDTAYANKRRLLQAQELMEEINQKLLIGEYANIPVIFGGDINSSYDREDGKYGHTGALTYFESNGYKDVQHTLSSADRSNSYNGYPNFNKETNVYTPGNNNGDLDASIDHCFYKGNVTPVGFDVMNNDAARRTSDHLPLVVDFKLN